MKITDIIMEAANPAQQAAIAIAMKKAGKKPQSEGMAEGAEFGAYYSEQVAQQIFDRRPDITSEDEVLNQAYHIVANDQGQRRARYMFNYDEDFASDLVSNYFHLQRQGVAEGSLEEVSQGTLKNYVKQAKRDVKSVDDAGIYNDTDLDILRRREKGLDTAKNKLKKLKQQGVAEGSREQVDPNTVWEVCFDYGPHQSDKVRVRASSQEEAEQKGMRAAKKLGHRFPQLNWAMPYEQGVAEGLTDVVKGIKRKVAGKEDPKEVEHMYGRMARSAIKNKTPDQAEKDIERYKKVSKVVNKEGVAEGLLGSDPNRGQKVPHWAKRGIVGKIGRKLDPAWSDVQMTVPQHLLSKQSSVPATNAPATKEMPKVTSVIPTRAIPQSAATKPTQSVTKNVVKTIADKQGMAEGINDTIYPNAEVIKSKNGRPVGEIYQDGNSWGCFHYRADRGYDGIDSREDAIQDLKDLHNETLGRRPDYTIKGVAEGLSKSPVCKHCGKKQGEHRRGECPKGSKTAVGYTDYGPTKFEPKEPKKQGVAEDLSEEFDLIESIVEMIAEHNGVDADVVWEDLESLTEDELYVFAVTSDPLMEDWQKANKRDKTDGMSQKAVNAYRREHPGSKLKTAVTTKPSKLKKGGKASKRRKSYCSRSRGQMKMHSISCAKTPDKAICKARRRWNC